MRLKRSHTLGLMFAALFGTLFLVYGKFFTPEKPNANKNFIILQSTTSTDNSGLLKAILPTFKQQTGIDVRVVAVGTGQAIKNAERGDGDVLFVHDKDAEEKFVASGGGVSRANVMYNDFVIIGPRSDPANITGMSDVVQALRKIARSHSKFASRGDDSGTHKAEMRLWDLAKIDVEDASGDWYLSTGSGMGATLNTSIGTNAYALADRATWRSFKNRDNHDILVQGDPRLFNQYGVILVNPEKHLNVNRKAGQAFIDWLTGRDGQAAIAAFKIDGQQVFFPNAQTK